MTGAGPTGTTAVRALLTSAADAYADDPRSAALFREHLNRVDEPLRVAIAGKMKAGKSTLLNALVGEQIAPTDAGECAKVVTWYEHSATPRVLHRGGRRAPASHPGAAGGRPAEPANSPVIGPPRSSGFSSNGRPAAC